jgi:hypothetical protein
VVGAGVAAAAPGPNTAPSPPVVGGAVGAAAAPGARLPVSAPPNKPAPPAPAPDTLVAPTVPCCAKYY